MKHSNNLLTALCATIVLAFSVAKAGDMVDIHKSKADGLAALADIKSKDKSPVGAAALCELSARWHGMPVRMAVDKKKEGIDGFDIRHQKGSGRVIVTAHDAPGLLYAAYELLRMQATTGRLSASHIKADPAFKYRILSPSAFLNVCVGDSATGKSPWNWDEVNGEKGTMSLDQKDLLTGYARFCASVGINGLVFDSDGSQAGMPSDRYIDKVSVVAALLRPYAIQVYLTVRFGPSGASTTSQSGLSGDEKKEKSWKIWLRETYRKIPNLGGFVVFIPSHANADATVANTAGHDAYAFASLVTAEYKALAISGDALCSACRGALQPTVNIPYGVLPRPQGVDGISIMVEDRVFTALSAVPTGKPSASVAADAMLVPTMVGCDMSAMADAMMQQTDLPDTADAAQPRADADKAARLRAMTYAFGRMSWNPDLPVSAITDEWVHFSSLRGWTPKPVPEENGVGAFWGNSIY